MVSSRDFDHLMHKASKPIVSAGGSVVRFGASHATRWLGPVAAAAYKAYMDVREFNDQLTHIAGEYENEIGAGVGKRPQHVTANDMEEIARINPGIQDALTRAKRKRNLNLGITVACAVLTAVVVGTMVPVIAMPLGISSASLALLNTAASLALTATVSAVTYIASQKVFTDIGKKIFNLSEPADHDLHNNPYLQSKLSVSSQVSYLKSLQQRRTPISQEQLLTLYATASPELNKEIESRYGAPFAKLSDAAKDAAIAAVGPRYNLEAMTEDLNNRNVLATELAFSAYGQKSGVERLESPRITMLERANVGLQQQVNTLSSQLKHQASALGDKMTVIGNNVADKGRTMLDSVKDKLQFNKPQVSGVMPDQDKAQNALQPEGALGPHTAQQLVRRQQDMYGQTLSPVPG